MKQLQGVRGRKDPVGGSLKCPTSHQDSVFLNVAPDHAKLHYLFSLYLETACRPLLGAEESVVE